MALSKDIDRPLYQGDSRVYDVAATTTIYKGGLVSWNNSDGVRPFAVANTSDRILGVAEEDVDNSTGAAGDLTCSVRLGGTYWFKNDTTDTILDADIGDLAYGFDDETVRQYDSLKANIPVGVIVAVDATKGVMVAEVGEHPTPSEIHSVSITFAGASTVKTSTGDLSLQSTDDDVVIALGDAAGAKKLKVVDSAAAEVFAVDSNGELEIVAGQGILGAGALGIGVAAGAFDISVTLGDAAGAQKLLVKDSGGIQQASVSSDGALTLDGTASGITLATAATVKTTTGDLTVKSTDDDVVIVLGDAAGAKKLSIQDSGPVEVASVDSNGGVTCTALNVDGTVCLIPHAATATGGPPTQVEIAAAFGAAADGAVGVYDDTTPGVLYLCAATAARTWHYVAMTIGA